MKYLWFFIICWNHRNTPYYEFLEEYTLVLKAARRCSYDLAHASRDINLRNHKGSNNGYDYHKRSEMWKSIFSPTGGKDYRHELHKEIGRLKFDLDSAVKLLDENNVPHRLNDIPF